MVLNTAPGGPQKVLCVRPSSLFWFGYQENFPIKPQALGRLLSRMGSAATMDDVSDKEFQAGLSLLHMMQRQQQQKQHDDVPMTQAPPPIAVHDSLLLAIARQQQNEHEAAHKDEEEDDEDHEDAEDDGTGGGTWPAKGYLRRNAHLTTMSRELSLRELRVHFDKPIVQVAREFGICTTFLKKICRRCGIKRWPHRQIRSLSRTIQMLQQAEAKAPTAQERLKFASQIAHLEAQKRAVMEDPDANSKLKRVKKCAGAEAKSSPSKPWDGAPSGSDGEAAFHSAALDQLSVVASVINRTSSPLTEQPGGIASVLSSSPTTTTFGAAMSAGVRISPSNRKLLALIKGEAGSRMRSSSLGSMQGLNDEDEGETDVAVQPASLPTVEPATCS